LTLENWGGSLFKVPPKNNKLLQPRVLIKRHTSLRKQFQHRAGHEARCLLLLDNAGHLQIFSNNGQRLPVRVRPNASQCVNLGLIFGRNGGWSLRAFGTI
jgi:hypothetical protein